MSQSHRIKGGTADEAFQEQGFLWERGASVASASLNLDHLKNFLSVLLGVGLFQQRAPELGALHRVDEQQLPVLHRQPIIDHHLHPLAELPELQDRQKETSILQLT